MIKLVTLKHLLHTTGRFKGVAKGALAPPPIGTKLSILQSKILLYINNYNNISSMVIDEYDTYFMYFFINK
jgi:hypothetical protein